MKRYKQQHQPNLRTIACSRKTPLSGVIPTVHNGIILNLPVPNLVTSIIDPYSQKTPYAVKQSAGILGGLDEEVE
jgi:hypothetical protein